MEEFEIKFLEVDIPELEKKLISIGAKKVGEYDYMRALLDYPDFSLNKNHSWLRLRTNGEETTLAYKQNVNALENTTHQGVKEIEVVVDNYAKTQDLLKSLGFVVKREEKNKRIRYTKGSVVFDIDSWPLIPPFVEIEANSFAESESAAKELGFNPKDGVVCSAGKVYEKYGLNTKDYSLISFEKMVKKE
jgi:adenylate cyclase class 2